MRKKGYFFLIFLSVILFCFWLIVSLFPDLPRKEEPICFYATQCRQDLKRVLLCAIHQAKKSLHVITFGLNDLTILHALEEKAKEGIAMKVFYDKKNSSILHLSNHEAYPLCMKGFMHQKIVIIDEKLVFIGSANLTYTSLHMHDNLLLGFYCPQLAQFLQKNTPFYPGYFSTTIENQRLEMYILPDPRKEALRAIQKEIQKGQKKITVCMFTLTHPFLVNELILAHKRGVAIQVFVDYHSGLGSSLKAVKKLQEAHVPIFLHQGSQLFHHKYAVIDDKVLICGSTNWTLAAFKKNQDCFLILHDLTNKQKSFLQKLEKTSRSDSQIPKQDKNIKKTEA
ncbi:MAG: phospholipase D-like domain-containing protein [Chlamydiota bacterium]